MRLLQKPYRQDTDDPAHRLSGQLDERTECSIERLKLYFPALWGDTASENDILYFRNTDISSEAS